MEKNNLNTCPVHNRLLLLSLALSSLSVCLVTVAFQVLMVDVAASFQVQVGTASMVAAVGSISGIIVGLLLAVVSIRYDHKLLLLLGLVCNVFAALGYFFAPTFQWLLVSNIAVGAGLAIVGAMTYSIIGDVYPLDKRGSAVGVMVAATTLSFVIGSPLVGVLSTFYDWRMVTIILSLPVVFTCLILATLFIPRNTSPKQLIQKEPFSVGYKQAFSSVSGVAALSVTMFMFIEGAVGYYSVSFFREQFGVSVAWGSTYFLIANIVAAVGGAIAGLMVHRIGRKKLGTMTLIVACALTLGFTLMPTAELSGSLSVLRYFFSAMAMTAGGSLIIEQLPKFRSTLMSLNTAFMNIGMLVASLVGGFTLNSFGYQALGLVLGGLGLLGTIIWIALVRDP
ncbi:MAG TPA: MFS transporter, partial [Candidatus Acidoferrales bacterium]|nr:MFS transporter [Candidatus Acidoferrales bacterium]